MPVNKVQVIAAGAVLAAWSGGAVAQGTSISLGSLEHDTSLPVEVTSDTLNVANDQGRAIFDGNVIVIQGPMRLAAEKIEVEYATDDEGGNDITQMTATGGVTFVNGDDAAESREAVYDPDAGTLVMIGDVLLTQGPSVISGERLVVNLASGTGIMEGRVRTLFQTGDN